MSTAADILDGAAEIIERDGWVQGAAAAGFPGDPTCAGIAIDRATQAILGVDGMPEHAWSLAMKSLRDVVRTDAIVGWNDTPGRTQTEVVSALRRAAEAVR